MKLTELLITGFDGDSVAFAATLSPDAAAGVFASLTSDGSAAVDSVEDDAGQVFARILTLVEPV